VKARQVLVHVTGASLMLLAAAGSLNAQSTANTQRPLRPGQQKGPTFMVPVFRSQDKSLGLSVADAVRDRLMSDNLMTSMWVVSKKDLNANLELSGYSPTDALSEGDLKQLAVFIKAEQYVDGIVTRGADGNLTLVASLNLPRGEGMVQPLGTFTGAKSADVAGKVSAELEKARKQIPAATACLQSNRQRQYEEAKAHAAKAIKEYQNSVFGRICLLEVAIAQKASDADKIKIAEEILAIAPENDRALEVVTDAYATISTTDKAYEEKYIASLERLLTADPTNTSLQAQVVRALGRAQKWDKAKVIIDEAVKQSPGDPELIKLQWGVYRAMNNMKGAIPIGEEMIKHDTAAADTLFYQQLVAAYLADSQPQKAQDAAARGAAKFPTNVTLWLSVAQLARQNGQLPQALEAISKVMALDPKNTTAALQKAQIFSEQDQMDSMTVALRAAVAAGAPKDIASGMILNKVNPWLQRWSKDTAKTVAEGERMLGVVFFADSLNSSPTTALFSGLVQLQLGQTVLGEAAKTRNCELAKKGRDYVSKSQEVLPKAGRQFPDQTAGAMNGVMQLMPYGEQVERAVCRPGAQRPPR
jgi:tetratricopeptide (TPR) repeat protein